MQPSQTTGDTATMENKPTDARLVEMIISHSPREVPPCHVCGGELTLEYAGPRGCMWACAADKGEHYWESRVNLWPLGDGEIVAALTELQEHRAKTKLATLPIMVTDKELATALTAFEAQGGRSNLEKLRAAFQAVLSIVSVPSDVGLTYRPGETEQFAGMDIHTIDVLDHTSRGRTLRSKIRVLFDNELRDRIVGFLNAPGAGGNPKNDSRS